ncbi:TolB-like translocation protein [Sphaerisporangium rhizosphaerae]|uniref:WD40 repeat domain-containing protein n=1 Tax=Sphaerisporangium rhizosphaerae TaxID=2269375 RepID=A0ABW2P2B5_9ACTN
MVLRAAIAALMAAIVAGGPAEAVAATPVAGAVAQAVAATPVVRYVGLGACLQDDGGRHPCGPWKVWLSNGRVVALPEARRTVAPGEYVTQAVVDVTQDGAQVAYFRERDGVLMIWKAATGKARPVPKVTWPDDLQMSWLTLAPGGRFVGLRGLLPSGREVERLVDTSKGKAFTLPKGYQSWGFSPDGGRMLAGNNRTAVLYATGTWKVKLRRSVYTRGALGPGGVTVAGIQASDSASRKNAVLLRNLATGKKTTIPFLLGKGERLLATRWDKAGHVDVLTRVDRGSGSAYRRTHTWYRLDRTTHRLRRLDSFVIPASVGGYVLTAP